MKLTDVAAKPQLIKVSLDDEKTIEEFGEALEFYTWDRQPIDKFVRFASTSTADFGGMVEIMREMILDDTGTPVMNEGTVLPAHILMRAISRVTEQLGK